MVSEIIKKENNNSKTSLSNYKTDFYKGNISDFVKAINDNTRVISLAHITNVVGDVRQ